MINSKKSTPSTEIRTILEREKQKESGTYRQPQIIEAIKDEFYNKCYLCEQKGITSINIEHFKPHRGDKELKFDWDNLFYSCAHCNNIKSDKYDTILNPTDENEDVEGLIHYSIRNLLRNSKVEIIALDEEAKTRGTAQLLEAIYNGTTTMKCIEAINIKTQLVVELVKFTTYLREYEDDETEDDEKEDLDREIRKKLNKKSAFSAFKRQIIKDESYLYDVFGKYID